MEKESVGHSKKKTNRPIVLLSIMLAMFMGAIEGTIVSTAMPAIVGELGDFSLYSWVFSSYLLMNTITVLIYGRLADLFGRKPIIIIGILIFIAGSILCGLADSMVMLIIFRLIQGFGAGAVTPIATTIVGDIYTKEERANIQGYLSSVWGISAILGPALGGILVEYVSWRFIFWVNIPLGIAAIFGVGLFLHESMEKKKREIDYLGALFLTIFTSVLMYILVEGGHRWPWASFPTLSLLTILLVVFMLFYFQEKKAVEPIMPLSIWKDRTILFANVTSLFTGIMLIGISSFLPTFVQGVMEYSPLVAGFTLTTMSIGWPLASTLSGKMMLKIGARNTSIIGGGALIAGALLFLSLTRDSSPFWAAMGSFLFGLGMGLTSTIFIVSIQNSVSWEQRGIATAANSFMRNLGNTIGAAFLGGILNNRMLSFFSEHERVIDVPLDVDSVNVLLNAEERSQFPQEILILLQDALTASLHTVYWVVLILGVFSLLFIFLLPKEEKRIS